MVKHGRSAWVKKLCGCDYCHEDMRLASERNNRKRGMKPSTAHRYTVPDIAILLDISVDTSDAARRIGVSPDSVRAWRRSMKVYVSTRLHFTDEQIEVLKEFTTNNVCAEKLGLSRKTVEKARKQRKIHYPRDASGAKKGTVQTHRQRAQKVVESTPVWRPMGFAPIPGGRS